MVDSIAILRSKRRRLRHTPWCSGVLCDSVHVLLISVLADVSQQKVHGR